MTYRLQARTGARSRAKLRCARHGKMPWRGDIICERCDRVYLRSDADTFEAAPESGDCVCGARLFPKRAADGKSMGLSFSARAVCAHCADLKTS